MSGSCPGPELHSCPQNHISGCRYIVMMHPSDADTELVKQESISNITTIASVGKHTGASRTKTMLEDGMMPAQGPGWFKVVSDRHPPTSSRPELESASVGNLVWFSTTMHPITAASIEEQRAHRINAGQNVTVYVVDTGVNIDHKDFEGRAQHGLMFLPGMDDSSDVNGHETFVAALAAGPICGVAKKARIVSLETLDDSSAGRLSNVLAAIEWVVRQRVSQGAMTVGETDRDDAVASYSNWGPCVAVYAPGSDIVSAWRGSKTASHVQSGTSMAYVAGLMALLLSESPDENIPVRTLADMILRTVTRFSFDDQSMPKTARVLAGIPLSLVSSDVPEGSVRGGQPGPLEIYGKALARNLVYVGSSTHKDGNETEIEDLPATFSTSPRRTRSQSRL
ncbi:hypothetical protein BGX34_001774 [Mortierella sp. NVP85]|nr:hypothetical protein BGX34_001774 [Mortierella sp. NVP85]